MTHFDEMFPIDSVEPEEIRVQDALRIVRDFPGGIEDNDAIRILKILAMMRNTRDLIDKWDREVLQIESIDSDGYPMFREVEGPEAETQQEQREADEQWRLN